jgi:hypothetical protein
MVENEALNPRQNFPALQEKRPMKKLLCAALIVIALIAIATGLTTTGEPAR